MPIAEHRIRKGNDDTPITFGWSYVRWRHFLAHVLLAGFPEISAEAISLSLRCRLLSQIGRRCFLRGRHPDELRKECVHHSRELMNSEAMAFSSEEAELLETALHKNFSGGCTERLPLGITLATVDGMEDWGHPRLNGSYFINDDANCDIRISRRQLCLFVQALRQAMPSGSDQSLHLPSWLSGFEEAEKPKASLRLGYRSPVKAVHILREGKAFQRPEELKPSNDEGKQQSAYKPSPVGVRACRVDDAGKVLVHPTGTVEGGL
ncbi:hypothetical protein [Gluconobacter sp. Gdi]|uniref:hypothetical protein n=1 Tax=Gluconobacter sp. Gdi TaxID=2691888 RepID=UPI0019218490|nr:hypothetical protein [Gluconobacter sp. Gdi]